MIAFLLVISLLQVNSEGADHARLARDYIQALADQDWDTAGAFYADSTVFEDPTADVFGQAEKRVGPDAIREFWEGASQGVEQTSYVIRDLFVSGNRVMIRYDSMVTTLGEKFKINKDKVKTNMKVFSILQFKNGKILRHTDYVSYGDFLRWLDKMRSDFPLD